MSNNPTETEVSRRGKWTREEEVYAKQLISYFKSGLLPIDEGTSLRNLLAQLLKCDPMRITKKFTGEYAIGKREFIPVSDTCANAELVKAAQADLLTLRDEWLSFKTYGSRLKRKAEVSVKEVNRSSKRIANVIGDSFNYMYGTGKSFGGPEYASSGAENARPLGPLPPVPSAQQVHGSADYNRPHYNLKSSNVIGDRHEYGSYCGIQSRLPLPSEIYQQMIQQKVLGPGSNHPESSNGPSCIQQSAALYTSYRYYQNTYANPAPYLNPYQPPQHQHQYSLHDRVMIMGQTTGKKSSPTRMHGDITPTGHQVRVGSAVDAPQACYTVGSVDKRDPEAGSETGSEESEDAYSHTQPVEVLTTTSNARVNRDEDAISALLSLGSFV